MGYAEELKAQIAEQAANKVREKQERMGLGLPASHNAVSGETAHSVFVEGKGKVPFSFPYSLPPQPTPR